MKTTEQQHNERKRELMEKCFECYAENGLTGTGIKALADACGCTKANLYSYFKNLDELIIESTAYCMEKVEDDFMEMAPTDPEDVVRFVKEVPYWTAKKHGKKYRLMYQIYTHPKYIEHGKKFFEGVNERYTEYAKRLEPKRPQLSDTCHHSRLPAAGSVKRLFLLFLWCTSVLHRLPLCR